MTLTTCEPGLSYALARNDFPTLLDAVRAQGYDLIGPKLRDGAIVYDHIEGARDLPTGWTDKHGPGMYRVERRDDAALFGYSVGPESWKRFLHAPHLTLWSATRAGKGFTIEDDKDEPIHPMAFLGVRSCELAAIAVQDRVLMAGNRTDEHYERRRRDIFTIAVQCTRAGATCFCASMHTGPSAAAGFDIALTELIDRERHLFLAEVGTSRGARMLEEVPVSRAGGDLLAEAHAASAAAAKSMGRELDTRGIKELLYRNAENPLWDQIATRCLSCGNCTMVCPTCFCTSVTDTTDLSGDRATRFREWDSCFTADFSFLHGGAVRSSTGARYRQWLTHKLASWQDQFGTSGCVGCGRCIDWCPVGIDITKEVAAIRAADQMQPGAVTQAEVKT